VNEVQVGPALALLLGIGIAVDLFIVPRERAFEDRALRRRRNWFHGGLVVLALLVMLSLPWR
jgi:hypothetical protein